MEKDLEDGTELKRTLQSTGSAGCNIDYTAVLSTRCAAAQHACMQNACTEAAGPKGSKCSPCFIRCLQARLMCHPFAAQMVP